MHSCNTADKLQAVYLSCRKQTTRHSPGLDGACLTIHKQRNHAERGLVYHATNTTAARESGPVCYAVKRKRAAQRRYMRAYSARRQPSPTRNHVRRSIPHAFKASPVEGLATGQCSAAQHDTTQPRRNGSIQRETTPCSPVHATPGGLCKFAQIRAVQALQNRPMSTTRDALQELQAAISNGLAAFQSTPGSAAQGIPDRPPGVDTLRLCAVGVEFS